MQLLLIKKKYITFIFSSGVMAYEEDYSLNSSSQNMTVVALKVKGSFFKIKLLAIIKSRKKDQNKKLFYMYM